MEAAVLRNVSGYFIFDNSDGPRRFRSKFYITTSCSSVGDHNVKILFVLGVSTQHIKRYLCSLRRDTCFVMWPNYVTKEQLSEVMVWVVSSSADRTTRTPTCHICWHPRPLRCLTISMLTTRMCSSFTLQTACWTSTIRKHCHSSYRLVCYISCQPVGS